MGTQSLSQSSSASQGRRDRIVWLLMGLLFSVAYVAVAGAGTIAFLAADPGAGESASAAVLHLALAGYLCWRVVARLVAGSPPWGGGRQLTLGVLRGFARAWWIGLAGLFLIALIRALAKFGQLRVDPYAIADAFGLVVVALVMSIPALVALAVAHRLEPPRPTHNSRGPRA